MGRRLGDILGTESDLHLVTDGKSIYLEDSNDRIIDILKNARQPMFLVCVTDQIRRINANLRPTAPRKPARSESVPSPAKRSKAV